MGKGGSGKSTLAGLLSAVLAEGGEPVVALDADPVPGLAQVLGIPPTDDWFLAGMASRAEGGGWQLEGTVAETVDRGARPGPAGVRFLQLGNIGSDLTEMTAEQMSAFIAFATVVKSFDDQHGWVLVDLYGGTLQVAAGMVGTTGVALVVVEPFAKSLLTARRLVGMGEWPAGLRLVGVANKVASPEDESYVETELSSLGVPLWASIPHDPAIAEAERRNQPLYGLDRESSAMRAVGALAQRLRDAAAIPAGAGAAKN